MATRRSIARHVLATRPHGTCRIPPMRQTARDPAETGSLARCSQNIRGMHENIAVTRYLRSAVLRLRYGVVDHFRRGRAGRKGPNRRRRSWRLRTGSEQSASCGDDKGAANCSSHLWFSAVPNRYRYLRRRAMTTELTMPVRGTPASLGSAASALIFGAEFLEFCSHRRKPALKDTDDLIANFSCRKGG
jgi:hypothetical protein